MRKIKENALNLILIAIIIILVLACKKQLVWLFYYAKGIKSFKFVFPFINNQITNDTFFTVAMGNHILQNGISKFEILTWHNELIFQNPRWLFDVFLAFLYKQVGINGIYIYTIIMSIILLGLVYFVSYKMNKNWKISFIYTLVVWYLCRFSFYARAWQFSFIFIVLEFYFIQKIIAEGQFRYSAYIILMAICLVNIHASVFSIYLVMFLPYLAEEVLYKFKIKIANIEIEEVANFKRLIKTLAIVCLVAFLNPFGALPYTFMFKSMSSAITECIGELAPTTFYNNKIFFIILAVTFICVIIGILSNKKIKITDIFYILGFSIITLAAYRSFCYFVLISGMCIIRIINNLLKNNNWKVNKYLKLIVIELSSCLFLFMILTNIFMNMNNELIPKENYPIELSNYILEEIDMQNMKLYNGFNYGSYLEFKGIKTFIDSRAEVFCEEFNHGCTVLEDWNSIYKNEVGFEEIFEKYNFTHAIANKNEKLSEDLKNDSSWIMIFSDDYWELYKKEK